MKLWKAILKDGRCVIENPEKSNWLEISKDVVQLELNNNGQIIKLPTNMSEYIQGKSASADLSTGKCQIESRYLGWRLGNSIVRIRVNEKTNNISIEMDK